MLFYLASPYSHPNSIVREHRFAVAEKAIVWLLRQKIWAFSPIVHCHKLAKENDLPKDAEFWSEFNEALLLKSDGVLVLTIDGWVESKGVQAEINLANRNKIRVVHILAEGAGFSFDCIWPR
jgi:hypothetical protein